VSARSSQSANRWVPKRNVNEAQAPTPLLLPLTLLRSRDMSDERSVSDGERSMSQRQEDL
jgi:hypothetical protein